MTGKEKRYEILDSLPTDGPMAIPITDDEKPFYSEGFVVRFFKDDGTNWVANFKPGWTGTDEIYEFSDKNTIIVFAGGLGYEMNPNEQKSIRNFGLTINEVFQTSNSSLVCADGISIHFFDSLTGEIWRSERISWDGFKDLEYQNEILTGKSFNPTDSLNEWSDFSLNLKTKELIGGSYVESLKMNPHIPKVQLLNKNQSKPWWKIW